MTESLRKLKILIIGGYGTFGSRIARLLADEANLELIIGGRSAENASQFVAQLSGSAAIVSCQFDRDGDLNESFSGIAPDLIIDASGPFHSYGENPYRVVESAISHGIHYLDLADNPEFVLGISRFDKAAKEANLFVLSGVSTCPALSGAILRRISRDFTSVDQVSGGIAPSPHAGVGLSVIRGIAAYAGQARTRCRAGESATAYPLTEVRRQTIAPPGQLPLRSLEFSLVDVPDLQLLGEMEPTADDVWFGAAPVPAIYHAILRLLAKAVKHGILPTLEPLTPFMYGVMKHFSWGENRGGLFLICQGVGKDRLPLRRSWHLVAAGNAGPTIPALAAVAVVRSCLAKGLPEPGARAAHNELELNDFEPMFEALAIQFGERDSTPCEEWPLFRRSLGDAWTILPKPIADLHDVLSCKTFSGQATVTRGRSLVATIVARLVGFPPSGDVVPITVAIDPSEGKELWMRDFDGHRFSSTMSAGEGTWDYLLCERFGLIRFGIALVVDEGRLHYVIRHWSIARIPMPRFLRPKGVTYETVSNGRFEFHVEIVFPLLGHIVTYAGWLEESDKLAEQHGLTNSASGRLSI